MRFQGTRRTVLTLAGITALLGAAPAPTPI
jgi:hypothetical protein